MVIRRSKWSAADSAFAETTLERREIPSGKRNIQPVAAPRNEEGRRWHGGSRAIISATAAAVAREASETNLPSPGTGGHCVKARTAAAVAIGTTIRRSAEGGPRGRAK